MEQFKIGDRVKLINIGNARDGFSYSWGFPSNSVGIVGTVIVNTRKSQRACGYSPHKIVGVRFDTPISGGHSLTGNCTDGYGQYVLYEDLELLKKRTMQELYQELKQPYK